MKVPGLSLVGPCIREKPNWKEGQKGDLKKSAPRPFNYCSASTIVPLAPPRHKGLTWASKSFCREGRKLFGNLDQHTAGGLNYCVLQQPIWNAGLPRLTPK